MRAFAVLSFAVAALAAPAALAPAGSVANVIAPVFVPAKAIVGAVAGVGANVNAAAANVNAEYNNIGNGVLDKNHVNVLSGRGINIKNVGAKNINTKVNADDLRPHVITSDHEKRGLVNIVTFLWAVLNALIETCAKVGVDAYAAIANVNVDYNQIANNVGNNNHINALSTRGAVDLVTPILTAILAVVKVALAGDVSADVLAGNIQLVYNNILNNVGNGNTVNVASRSLVAVVSPIGALIELLIQLVVKLGLTISADVLNVCLSNNNILNNVLTQNTVNILSRGL